MLRLLISWSLCALCRLSSFILEEVPNFVRYIHFIVFLWRVNRALLHLGNCWCYAIWVQDSRRLETCPRFFICNWFSSIPSRSFVFVLETVSEFLILWHYRRSLDDRNLAITLERLFVFNLSWNIFLNVLHIIGLRFFKLPICVRSCWKCFFLWLLMLCTGAILWLL